MIVLDDTKYFARKFEELRQLRKISQVQLAKQMKRSQSFVCQLGTGVSHPTWDDIYQIAVLFRVPTCVFFPPTKNHECQPGNERLSFKVEGATVTVYVRDQKKSTASKKK
jgi:transcriptional regulator with XRE-family HTH domain